MKRKAVLPVLLVLAVSIALFAAQDQENEPQPPTAEEVGSATERGIAYLLKVQEADGSWAGMDRNLYYGMSALAVYTLLQCGVGRDHPAIRAALAYVDARPCHRTYDVGCALMAYHALGEERPAERVWLLTRQLVETLGNGSSANPDLWGYPFGFTPNDPPNYTDLSNTQYALLGLRAGAKCGEKVPLVLWEKVARNVLELQGDYGSFRYLPGRKPSASMTVAGLTCLLVCREQLERHPKRQGLVRQLDAACGLAEEWLRRNWSVTENIQLPREEGPGPNRWLYYYIYGLERVGSLANRKLVAGHDWYAEGARALLDAQHGDGSWGSPYGENDTNTCFALLFLKRGTSTTKPEPRGAGVVAAGKPAEFEIGTNGENPLVVWVRGLGRAIEARLETDERIVAVEWRVNGVPVGRVEPDAGVQDRLQRFTLRIPLERNGGHTLQAVMAFADAVTGENLGEESSTPLTVTVDGVEESSDREAMRDAGVNLAGVGLADASASSFLGGHEPERAVDGRFGTSWRLVQEDPEPWIKVSLKRPATASVLKLCSAHPFLGGEADWDRPQDIEVRINGGRPLKVRLLDTVTRKQSVAFEPTRVRSVRIVVRSVYPGTRPGAPAGFKEIELFESPGPDALEAARETTTLVPREGKTSASWRYTTTRPGEDWSAPGFDDSAWLTGGSSFGSDPAQPGHGTDWSAADIWLRHELLVPGDVKGRLVMLLKCDDTAEVYVNGRFAGASESWSAGRYLPIPLPPGIAAAVKPGRNTIAVHCRNSGGAAFVDLSLLVLSP